MADGMVALKISTGRVQIRGRVRMAGQDELRQMEAFRLAGEEARFVDPPLSSSLPTRSSWGERELVYIPMAFAPGWLCWRFVGASG
jgi:hypothetical protein